MAAEFEVWSHATLVRLARDQAEELVTLKRELQECQEDRKQLLAALRREIGRSQDDPRS